METLREFPSGRPPVNLERRNGIRIVSDAIAMLDGLLFAAPVMFIAYLVLR